MEHKQLSNAPIVEAVLDIRVQLPDEVSIETLRSVHERIKNDYPERTGRTQLSAHVQARAPYESVSDAGVSATQVGYLFWSTDKRQAAQARLDGFSFSRLQPYQSWQALRDEARRVWSAYVEITKPKSIERVALRYINRMELPAPLNIEEFLATFPKLGGRCPQSLSDFFVRLVAQHDAGTVVITEAIDQRAFKEGATPIILDIDAFRQITILPSENERLWSIFEEIRNLKNDVFFGSITEKAVGLFE